MRVALTAPLYEPIPGPDGFTIRDGSLGYGGIERIIATLRDAFVTLGHEVTLFAHRKSYVDDTFSLIPCDSLREQREFFGASAQRFEILHDHTPWDTGSVVRTGAHGVPWVSTTHVKDHINWWRNVVYVSESQREGHGATPLAPVIRLPVNPDVYYPKIVEDHDDRVTRDYLLFMAAIRPCKGLMAAACLAQRIGMPLMVCGPIQNIDYYQSCRRQGGQYFEYLGVVTGEERLMLLQEALATLCLYDESEGWREPGATVVSESAACGTPVIAFPNGCLSEIVPGVGVIVENVGEAAARTAMLPDSRSVRQRAIERWGHLRIAQEYITLFSRVQAGETWSGHTVLQEQSYA